MAHWGTLIVGVPQGVSMMFLVRRALGITIYGVVSAPGDSTVDAYE